MTALPVASEQRDLDAICLGRAGVDLYAREAHTAMADVSGFDKYVGGSPANIAIGMAKLGAKVGFIGAISNDPLGHYVRQTLLREGVNIDGLHTAPEGSRTSLAVTEMRPENCEVVIYRNNAADLSLEAAHIDAGYIARARLLIVSGTALSASPSREAVYAALLAAEQHQTPVLLDLDYRAYSWQSPAEASTCYRLAARFSDIVIGNREEFAVLNESEHGDAEIAEALLMRASVVMIKSGAAGSSIFTRSEQWQQPIFPVVAKKPFGAGDAYAAAIAAGLLEGRPLKQSVRRGAAAAAMVVAGDSCSAASPTPTALDAFIQQHG